MDRRTPPQTDEGWYALHDFRTVDWDAWREAPDGERQRAVDEGVDYLRSHEALEDSEEGGTAAFSVLGHDADLLIFHLRPSMTDLDLAQRRFERTALAAYTDRADSYVSVTEVSGYMSQEYFEEDEDVENNGMARYIESRLEPDIPDANYVSFYPMEKRRDPEFNWYDLPFEERADLMAGHGDIGREYAGKVTQIITGSVGLDDWEWGVTLFADYPTDIKDLLYEMRFDPSTSRFADFGSFYVGRRFPPEDLGALLAGEPVPAEEAVVAGSSVDASPAGSPNGTDDRPARHAHSGGGSPHRGGRADGTEQAQAGHDSPAGSDGDVRGELEDLDIYSGQPHGENVHAMVLYSEADPDELFDEVDGLRANFEHYDTHVKTALYENPDGSRSAVVSLWETQSAAETAGGFLGDLPGVVERSSERSGFGTMGMFYTVKPEHREAFVEKFETVGDLLSDMEGHHTTSLLVNREDENDMFVASQWDSKEDAMAFFRSEEFADTVSWGRDVLADRPRHVFLA